ncbi:MAG: hypothetical protein IPG09_14640 [Ignavibacteria bacterium]|nr:hypothetical protein [Ignavibacteria bacterium]
MKWLFLLLTLNVCYCQSESSNALYSKQFKINGNGSSLQLSKNKLFTDIRFSVGGGIGILYGNKLATVNLHSLLTKDLVVTVGADYFFIKNKEERQLKNFFSPTMLLSYKIGVDRKGNELLLGGGVSYENFRQLKLLVSLKGNLYLRNSFYLGLEIKQPFLDPIFTNSQLGFFISPYLVINIFYTLKY